MSKGEETRQEIIRSAAPIFNRKGFEGTALSDLMNATGLKKGGIYRHFESKEQLAGEAFDYAWRTAVEVRRIGAGSDGHAVDRLKQMVRNFAERREGLVPGGCPLLNTAIDADSGNRVLRARARKALEEWRERIRKIAADGMVRGEMERRACNPEKLSAMVIGMLEGSLMICRLEQSNEPMLWACDHLESYLESLRRGGVKKTGRTRRK
jgi:TetR/AcrR family transcriptional regulator, transcriptional repressor for nem operon